MHPDDLTTARDIAAGAVAQAGRWHALRWALGLVRHVEGWTDVRDVVVIAIAVLRT